MKTAEEWYTMKQPQAPVPRDKEEWLSIFKQIQADALRHAAKTCKSGEELFESLGAHQHAVGCEQCAVNLNEAAQKLES